MPVFSRVGRIYELRLMIEFSGCTRSYCYVKYSNQAEANSAIAKINHFKIRPGVTLAVTLSADNKLLVGKLVPPMSEEKSENKIVGELVAQGVEGVTGALVENATNIRLEFSTHRLAALARRQLIPGNYWIFGSSEIRQIEWAEPEVKSSGLSCSERVLEIRGIPSTVEYSAAMDIFNKMSGGQVITMVKTGSVVIITLARGGRLVNMV